MSLPINKMYALRHGITGKVWTPCGPDGLWLFESPARLEKTWNNLKKVGLVSSEFREHRVITVELVELK